METTIIQDYERQRLLEYADSFRELADSFQNFKTEEENEKIMQAEGTRGVIFWERQLSEQRSVFARQLQEMSRMLFDIASQERSVEKISEKKYRQLVREMKSEGILVGDLLHTGRGRAQKVQHTDEDSEICQRLFGGCGGAFVGAFGHAHCASQELCLFPVTGVGDISISGGTLLSCADRKRKSDQAVGGGVRGLF